MIEKNLKRAFSNIGSVVVKKKIYDDSKYNHDGYDGSITTQRDSIASCDRTNPSGKLSIELSPDKIGQSNGYYGQYTNLFSYALKAREWTMVSGVTSVANAVESPWIDRADTIVMADDAADGISKAVTTEAADYNFSVYAKLSTGTGNIRLSNGTAGSNIAITDEWTRISGNFSCSAGTTTFSIINDSAGGAKDVYLWGMQVTKSEFTLPVVFGSNLNEIDSPIDLSHSDWTKTNCSIGTGADGIYARVGESTDRITASADDATCQSATFTGVGVGDVYQTCLILKKNTGTGDVNLLIGDSSDYASVDIDLDAGTVTDDDETDVTIIKSEIVSLSDDWYRVNLLVLFHAAITDTHVLITLDANSDAIDVDTCYAYGLSELWNMADNEKTVGGFDEITYEPAAQTVHCRYDGEVNSSDELVATTGNNLDLGSGASVTREVPTPFVGKECFETGGATGFIESDSSICSFGTNDFSIIFLVERGTVNGRNAVSKYTGANPQGFSISTPGSGTHCWSMMFTTGSSSTAIDVNISSDKYWLVLEHFDRDGNHTQIVNFVKATQDISSMDGESTTGAAPLRIGHSYQGYKILGMIGREGVDADPDKTFRETYIDLMAFADERVLDYSETIAAESSAYETADNETYIEIDNIAEGCLYATFEMNRDAGESREDGYVVGVIDKSSTTFGQVSIIIDESADEIIAFIGGFVQCQVSARGVSDGKLVSAVLIYGNRGARLTVIDDDGEETDTSSSSFPMSNLDRLCIGNETDDSATDKHVDTIIYDAGVIGIRSNIDIDGTNGLELARELARENYKMAYSKRMADV